MKKMFMLLTVLCLTALCLVQAAPVPDEVLQAVNAVAAANGLHPRHPHYLLEQFVPAATGDQEQCAQLAHALMEAFAAQSTTDAGRTILAQHLAKVAGEAENKVLRKMTGDPGMAADIRIALNELAYSSLKDEGKAHYLAEISSDLPAKQIAGLAGITQFYPKDAAKLAGQVAGNKDSQVSAFAMRVLAQHNPSALVKMMASMSKDGQLSALQVVEQYNIQEADEVAAKLASNADAEISRAAIAALGSIGNANSVPVLAAAGAVESLAKLNAKGVDGAILKAVNSGSDIARVAAIQAAEIRGIVQMEAALLKAAGDENQAVAVEALKVLGRSGDTNVYPALVALLGGAGGQEVELAVRRMIKRLDGNHDPLPPLAEIMKKSGASENIRVAVLRSLSAIGSDAALVIISENISAPSANIADAALRALAQWPDPAAMPLLKKVTVDQDTGVVHRTLCERAIARFEAGGARLSALAAINCGVQDKVQGKSGVLLAVIKGASWKYTDEPAGTVAYDGNEVVIEVSGLDPAKKYQACFVWWDYDNNGRVQSVQIGNMRVLDKTPLPAWKDKNQPAASLAINIPASEIKGGRATIRFKREGASNSVVSEVWIAEGETTGAPAPQPVAATVVAATKAPAIAKPDPAKFGVPILKSNKGAEKRVLVVTGNEYPGHKWQETAPEIVKLLAEDKRLEVSYTENYTILASKEIFKYDTLFLNYQSHNEPGPAGGIENLAKYLHEGGSMVLFHFACGAFIGYPEQVYNPEFMQLAGRSWNPKLRGHDPRREFTVNIVDKSHPITKGMEEFTQSIDELYTCLDGDAPIHVLATAVSTVDKKVYPMAFTYNPGKGRVFHCVLGHSLESFNPAMNELYRRGTAWAAGL